MDPSKQPEADDSFTDLIKLLDIDNRQQNFDSTPFQPLQDADATQPSAADSTDTLQEGWVLLVVDKQDTSSWLDCGEPLQYEWKIHPAMGKRFSSRPERISKMWRAHRSLEPNSSDPDIERGQKQTGSNKHKILASFSNTYGRSKPRASIPTPPSLPFKHTLETPLTQKIGVASPDMVATREHKPAPPSARAETIPAIPAPRRTEGDLRRYAAFTNLAEDDLWSNMGPECKFPCTFCTRTFRTERDWQQHEEALHLSLKKWRCARAGPNYWNQYSEISCVYCGKDSLKDANISDNDRPNKLQQQPRKADSLDHWRRQLNNLWSRCGFCGHSMHTWNDRAVHLADHFKQGKTMADWMGDWGFDAHILNFVENAIPPRTFVAASPFFASHFLTIAITDQNHHRRSLPPSTIQKLPIENPLNAFELINLELEHWVTSNRISQPTVQQLQYESCCIILGSLMLCRHLDAEAREPRKSWLQDIIISSEDLVKRARARPLKSNVQGRITDLQVFNNRYIFDNCSAEHRLQAYACFAKDREPQVEDEELQLKASRIVWSMAIRSPTPAKMFAGFLDHLIFASTDWLVPFRRRANQKQMDYAQEVSDHLKV
ncbi:homeobox and c2h2 transcription factor [Fusarium albosuccineum]|uniref:Homeobox and c2h2 transcription factor n=1 Tax=Fusarium albosuccineum TaxID=1237068 RepID=A0A8H4L9E4_9HYPO|nr:homeobox and c2h2 transcription factor [Fusarium albosuccineum]